MRAIEVQNVRKKYKDVTALDGVTLSFEFGKIYGLLGRNGAGKSTLINIIANRVFADGGQVLIDGLPAGENMAVREKLFCMSEKDLYDGDLKVSQHFQWAARFYDGFDLEKAQNYARKFHLDENKRFRGLSKGYQSIFKLIIALSLDVPYVIFDEPVLGLDANHRELFYALLLKEFGEKERTFILATHIIEEVAGLVEDVVFLDKGKVLVQQSAESLLRQSYSVTGPAEEVDRFCAQGGAIGYDTLGGLKIAYRMGPCPTLPEGSRLRLGSMTLQKLFVKMTEERDEI